MILTEEDLYEALTHSGIPSTVPMAATAANMKPFRSPSHDELENDYVLAASARDRSQTSNAAASDQGTSKVAVSAQPAVAASSASPSSTLSTTPALLSSPLFRGSPVFPEQQEPTSYDQSSVQQQSSTAVPSFGGSRDAAQDRLRRRRRNIEEARDVFAIDGIAASSSSSNSGPNLNEVRVIPLREQHRGQDECIVILDDDDDDDDIFQKAVKATERPLKRPIKRRKEAFEHNSQRTNSVFTLSSSPPSPNTGSQCSPKASSSVRKASTSVTPTSGPVPFAAREQAVFFWHMESTYKPNYTIITEEINRRNAAEGFPPRTRKQVMDHWSHTVRKQWKRRGQRDTKEE